MTDRPLTHDELIDSLAADLVAKTGARVYTNLTLGSAGSPIADLVSILPSYAHPRITVYEVKRTRADALRDIGVGKWTAYLAVAQCVVFACPAGVLRRPDVPPAAGLRVLSEKGWRSVSAGKPQPWAPPAWDFWLKLVIDGHTRLWNARAWKQEEEASYVRARRARERLGETVRSILLARESADAQIKQIEQTTQRRIERMREDEAAACARRTAALPALWEGVCSLLGLKATAEVWEARDRLHRLRNELDQRERARKRTSDADHARSLLQSLLDVVNRLEPPQENPNEPASL